MPSYDDRLAALTDAIARIAMGEFATPVPPPTAEDTLAELEVGVEMMRQDLLENVGALETTRAERSRLREVIELASDLVETATPEGVIEYVNPAGLELLGYELDELVGRKATDLHPEWSIRILQEAARPKLSRGSRWSGRVAFLHKDGTEILVSMSLRAHRDVHGNATFVSNISRRLDGQETANRELLEALPDLKFRMEADGTILEYIPGADELLYRSPDEFLGRRIADVLPQGLGAKFDERLERLRTTREVQMLQYRLDLPPGTQDFEARIFPVGEDQSLTVVRDISTEKNAERQLSRFRSILDSTTDFVGSAAPDGKAIYVNPTGLEMVGIDPNIDITTRSVRDFHSDATNELMQQVIFPAAMEHGSWTGEVEFLHVDGTRIPAWMVLLAHRGQDGEIEFFSTISRDLREKKKAEERKQKLAAAGAAAEAEREKAEQLQRALAELETAHEELQTTQDKLRRSATLAAVGQLAGGVAHDFNNLLAVILGFAALALDRLEPEAPAREDIEQIKEGAERAAVLTQQLLAFSRKKPVQPELLDLDRVVEDMSKLLGRTLGEHVQLENELADDRCFVEMDRGQLEQVLLNLSINARDSMPHGGHLVIRTERVDLRSKDQGLGLDAGQYVLLSVADDGAGMSPEVMERAFEPFFTTKEVGRGTGMGLATVFGVIKQAHGEIFLTSEVGTGTTVRIYLPAADAVDVPTPTALEKHPPVTGQRQTILLVEDEAQVLQVTRRILEKSGYSVLATSTGEEALALLKQRDDVDVLLTDVVMPGMSGAELSRRAAHSESGVKVVYMSGYPERATEYHELLTRDSVYLSKPFTPQQLLQKISEALGQKTS